MRAAIAAAQLVEHMRLPLAVGRRGVGLGDVERDLAIGERLEHDRCEAGEAQPALDEPDGDAEAPGNTFDVRAQLDEVLEGEAFVGGVERELLEVLRKARFRDGAAEIVKHETGDIEVGRRSCPRRQASSAPRGAAHLLRPRTCHAASCWR